MNDLPSALRLLRALYAGRTSRNREYARFATPSGRRLHHSYRLLRALRAEIAFPGAKAWIEPARGDGSSVTVGVAGLRYRRVVRLSRWEAEFLLRDMGGARFFSASPGGAP